jgi:hypothetical protein
MSVEIKVAGRGGGRYGMLAILRWQPAPRGWGSFDSTRNPVIPDRPS